MHRPNIDGSIPCELLSQDPLWPDAVSTSALKIGNEPATTYNMASRTHNATSAVQLPASGGKSTIPQLTNNVHRITSDGEKMGALWSKMVETTSRRALRPRRYSPLNILKQILSQRSCAGHLQRMMWSSLRTRQLLTTAFHGGRCTRTGHCVAW